MKDYNVGDTFYIGRKKFQVCEGECSNCAFSGMYDCFELSSYIGECIDREDKKEVYFKEIENE